MTIPTMPLSPTQRGDTPFTPASNTPSRVNTLRNMYATRGRMDTSAKTVPPTKAKHWTEKPDLVKTMHESIQLLINERDLLDENADLFTPESFITAFKIDTTLPYSEARKAAHVAANKAYADAILRDLEEHGVKPEHYAQAWTPFDTLEDAMNSTGVNLKAMKLKINAFTAGYFKERAVETINHTAKEQPAMTESELNEYFPREEVKKPSDPFPKAAATPAVPPLPETIKTALTEEQISALKDRLLKRVETTFPGETGQQHIERLRKALEAETFADFLYNNRTSKDVARLGDQMVDDYIMANGIKKGVQSAPNAKNEPSSEPTATDNPSPAPKNYELNEAEIRAKYTIQMKRFDRKQNKTIITDYLQVAGRVLLFRLAHRGGVIKTTIVSFDEKGALIRAEVFGENGNQLSSSHAYTSSVGTENFAGRYLEKAETSAIGRALAIAGFGTDAAGEDIDEDDQLSDSPVERKVA